MRIFFLTVGSILALVGSLNLLRAIEILAGGGAPRPAQILLGVVGIVLGGLAFRRSKQERQG
jgi:hypothetical protein